MSDPSPEPTVVPDADELKERLTPLQFEVTQHAGTERAFTGEYWDCHDAGTYHCIVCDAPLFSSRDEVRLRLGLARSATRSTPRTSTLVEDRSHGMVRTEVRCGTCDAHLGHVFPDGPKPTGDRFCMNSASLKLEPS